MIKKENQVFNTARRSGGRTDSGGRDALRHLFRTKKDPEKAGQTEGETGIWISSASYCTTGQFKNLEKGYKSHCGPTAVVNIVRTLEKSQEKRSEPGRSSEEMFLEFAGIGRRTRIYWNQNVLGYFGGTFNLLTGIFVRACLRSAGLGRSVSVRFHPLITGDAVEKALKEGSIVLLQVYFHPKYKNHHMVCYACRRADTGEDIEADAARGRNQKDRHGEKHQSRQNKREFGRQIKKRFRRQSGRPRKGKCAERRAQREFLLADGWTAAPLWVGDQMLGHGHFLTIRPV